MQKFRIMPPTGYPVQWYPSGDRTNPVPATLQCIEGSGSGMAILTVLPPGAKMFDLRKFVFHAEAPELRQKTPDWVQKFGTWDYIPGMPRLGEIPKGEWNRAIEEKAREQEAKAKEEANLKLVQNPELLNTPQDPTKNVKTTSAK